MIANANRETRFRRKAFEVKGIKQIVFIREKKGISLFLVLVLAQAYWWLVCGTLQQANPIKLKLHFMVNIYSYMVTVFTPMNHPSSSGLTSLFLHLFYSYFYLTMYVTLKAICKTNCFATRQLLKIVKCKVSHIASVCYQLKKIKQISTIHLKIRRSTK